MNAMNTTSIIITILIAFLPSSELSLSLSSIIILTIIVIAAIGLVAYAILKAGKDEDGRNPYE